MPKKEQSTYSGLSGVFDALFTVSEENGRKTKSANSSQKLFGVSDAFTNALPEVAAQLGAFPTLQNDIQSAVYSWVNAAGDFKNVIYEYDPQKREYRPRPTGVIDLDVSKNYGTILTSLSLVPRLDNFGNPVLDSYGKPIYEHQQVDAPPFEDAKVRPIQVPINVQNIISYFRDPDSFSQRIADEWLRQISTARQMKIIAGIGDAFQDAILYATARKAGVSGDIAAFVIDAKRNNTIFSPDKDARSSLSPLSASDNNQVRAAVANSRRAKFYAQAFAMNSGELDEVSRARIARQIEDALEFNANNFTISGIFHPVLADPSHPDYLQKLTEAKRSLLRVFSSVTDTLSRAALNSWLADVGPGGFESFARLAAEGTLRGGKGEGRIAAMAIANLAHEYGQQGYGGYAAKLIGMAATATELEGDMTLGERLLYTRARWNSLRRDLPGVFSVWGVVTGETWRMLANSTGYYGVSGKSTADFLAEWARKNTRFTNMGFYKRGEMDPMHDFLAKMFGNKVAADVGGFQINRFGIVSNQYLLSRDANGMQKFFYKMYTFSPFQIVQGAIDGSLFQRMLHIGTNFGQDLTRNNVLTRIAGTVLNNKYYQRWLEINRYTQYWIRFPFILSNKAIELSIRLVKKGVQKVKRKIGSLISKMLTKLLGAALKKALTQILKRGIDILTGGLAVVYDIVNMLTFGLLDKVVSKAIKAIIDVSLVTIAGLAVFVLMLWSNIGNLVPSRTTLNADVTFPPDPDYSPLEIDNPLGGVGSSDPKGYSYIDPGTDPVYSGNCQAIFNSVKGEYPYSTKASNASLAEPSGGMVWCNAYGAPVVSCRREDIEPYCTSNPQGAANLFRHELTHVVCSGSEFCAEVNGSNGGGYDFAAPEYFGNNNRYLATQIAQKISTSEGVDYNTIKEACWCNASAKSQLASKGIDLAKINATQGRRRR